MLNYANLNDVEFEYLCQDVMQKKLNTELHKFAKGRDGGIDLADNVNTKNIVVQVKHYMNSSVDQLVSSLKREVEKVSKFSPNQYYVCCSKELSPQKVNEIYQMFSDYMESPSNIITLNEIDAFLNDSANIEILKKHYKLWIESTRILQEINNTSVFIDCETLLADIESEKNLFVKTSAFTSALKCLEDNRTLFITGHPGVGKTITSKMLVLYYAAHNYKVRFSTNVSDLGELKNSLSRNPDEKEIILVDDCLGQAYFDMKATQSTELLSLINFVNASPNKLLILNSRITILQEAKERKAALLKCFENKQCKVYILDMSATDDVEKAKIFYNHISFNGMQAEYFSEIKKNSRYLNIIRHPNYTPRIIEFICNPNRYSDILASDYYDFIMQQLSNPKEIWKDEYERRLEKVDRLLLLTLYSLSDSTVLEQKVKTCFEHRIASEPDIDITINQYEASLNRLLDSFVQLVSEKGIKMLSMVNPSVNDYIDGRLSASILERKQLIEHVFSIQQKKRLLTEEEFNTFVKSALKSHEIEKYLFDSASQKNAFIAYYVCTNKIRDGFYTDYIQKFLNDPYSICVYGKETIYPITIAKAILQQDIIDYYKIGDFISNECLLDQLLAAFEFSELVEIINLIDIFFNGANREIYTDIASEQLNFAIRDYCEDLNADDFDPDVTRAIEMASYFNGDYEDVDREKAESYIMDDIISVVEDEIVSQLSVLPEDIERHRDYIDQLSFSIYGAENWVDSYLDYGGYDYDDYRENRGGSVNSDSEIDYIFDRD